MVQIHTEENLMKEFKEQTLPEDCDHIPEDQSCGDPTCGAIWIVCMKCELVLGGKGGPTCRHCTSLFQERFGE